MFHLNVFVFTPSGSAYNSVIYPQRQRMQKKMRISVVVVKQNSAIKIAEERIVSAIKYHAPDIQPRQMY